MGLFDTIDLFCPVTACGEKIEVQSKGGRDPNLSTFHERSVPLGVAAYAIGDEVTCSRGHTSRVTTDTPRVALRLVHGNEEEGYS